MRDYKLFTYAVTLQERDTGELSTSPRHTIKVQARNKVGAFREARALRVVTVERVATPRVPTSRPERWADAVARARAAYDTLSGALDDLNGVRDEYADWRDNLPEGLQSSTLGEKLDAVADLDTEPSSVLGEVESLLDEAEAVDLPRGFGND